jgi:hypothetical protein
VALASAALTAFKAGTGYSRSLKVALSARTSAFASCGHTAALAFAALCHKRTDAPQQKSHHSITVGMREQHGRQ